MVMEILVNTGSGNGLLPFKPLPEPVLTYHQWSPAIFFWWQIHMRHLSHQSLKLVWKLLTWISLKSSSGLHFQENIPGAKELNNFFIEVSSQILA